ncbi:Ferric uptake regulation protein [subsurface metagenome]|nr:transcriptional repressor [Bacillota bacterium]
MPGGPPWWHGKLRGWGYRMTIPRQVILDLLNRSSKHLSAEDIYLYRTLDLLEQMGIIHKFDFGDGRSRYELSQGPQWRHHHHLVCTKCGRIIDYTDFVTEEVKLLSKIEEALTKKYNFKINTHQLHFYGLCEKCR